MSTTPLLTKHHWAQYTIECGDVIVDPDNGEPLFIRRKERSIGEQVACAVCSEPLTAGSVVTLCAGLTESN